MKTLLLFTLALLISATTIAQNGINYKALIKDANGDVLANQAVTLQFSIAVPSAGAAAYAESHTTTTNANGIAIVIIGEGSPTFGNFTAIDWGGADLFLNVQVDIGSGFIDLGTTQFNTVPYALVAKNVSGLEKITEGGNTGWRLVGQNSVIYGDIGTDAIDLSISGIGSPGIGATGSESFASGYRARASGSNATAMGSLTNASGDDSTAIGTNTEASGWYSTAMGNNTRASGSNATAMSYLTLATGAFSTAMGNFTVASGTNSTAMGFDTRAFAFTGTAIGRYNLGGGVPFVWVETDPLFEIGNGVDDSNRSNALTVLKNGKVGIGDATPDGYLEVLANNSNTQPNINVVDEGSSGARINFTNTATTNGNVWTLFGDTDDTDSDSSFNIFHSNTGNIVDINGDGKVGINGNPDADFHVFQGNSQSTSGLKLQNTDNDNWWRMYVSSGTNELRLFNNINGTTTTGRFNATTGAYTTISDRRLKTNFKDLYFSWDTFLQLEPLTYNFKTDTSTKHIGLIAQDVEKIYPELISYDKEEDLYHLDYSSTGIVAIKAVQELKAENDALALKVATLEKKLSKYEALEARLSALENGSDNFGNNNAVIISAEKK